MKLPSALAILIAYNHISAGILPISGIGLSNTMIHTTNTNGIDEYMSDMSPSNVPTIYIDVSKWEVSFGIKTNTTILNQKATELSVYEYLYEGLYYDTVDSIAHDNNTFTNAESLTDYLDGIDPDFGDRENMDVTIKTKAIYFLTQARYQLYHHDRFSAHIGGLLEIINMSSNENFKLAALYNYDGENIQYNSSYITQSSYAEPTISITYGLAYQLLTNVRTSLETSILEYTHTVGNEQERSKRKSWISNSIDTSKFEEKDRSIRFMNTLRLSIKYILPT